MSPLLEKLGIRERDGIERFVQELIDILDSMDADPEAEPELGAPEQSAGWRDNADQSLWAQGVDGEPWLGWPEGRRATAEMSRDADRELVDEDGGDINNEAQDDDELEPFMGWVERTSQGPKFGIDCPPDFVADPDDDCGTGLRFNGDGKREARQMLREVAARPVPPKVEPIYDNKVERLPGGRIFTTPRQVNFIPSRSLTGSPYELRDDDFDRLPWG